MKRILFVANSLSYGGASKMMLWVASVLSEQNEVDISYINDIQDINPTHGLNIFKLTNKSFHDDPISRNTISAVFLSYHLCKLIKKKQYDMVISFGDHSFYTLCIAKWFNKFTMLVSERVDPYSSRRFTDKFRRFLCRNADFMVFQTNMAQKYYPGAIQNRSIVIPNPVVGLNNLEWNYDKSEKSIITVGRLDIIQKRQDILLRAFKRLLQSYPDYKLKIAGTGKDEQKLRKLIDELSLVNNVELLGYQNNIPELLTKSHLFVLTSDFEGIPNALIEALQVHMPIISTNCSPGGAALLLDNGRYGCLIERNNIEGLYNAMYDALTSKEKLENMSANTKDALERFSEKRIASKWKEYIKQCISEKQ